jgi:very-short-patch-repair endonuclease
MTRSPSTSQSNNRNLIINIEVDGTYHKQDKTKRFCMLRDEFLKAKGVTIERIDNSVLIRMNDLEVNEWILNRIPQISPG